MWMLSSFNLEQGHHPGISIDLLFFLYFHSHQVHIPNLHPPLLHHQWPWLWCKPDQKPPLFFSTLSQPGCLGHWNFSFQLQNTPLFSPTLVSPYWVCSRSAIPRWLSSRCQQSHPLYLSFFNQAAQKVEPSTLTINFSFTSSSSSALVIPFALPTSSFPHFCSQFHFNFLRLSPPPKVVSLRMTPGTSASQLQGEEAFMILHHFFYNLKKLSPFTASCSSGCQVFDGFLAGTERRLQINLVFQRNQKSRTQNYRMVLVLLNLL